MECFSVKSYMKGKSRKPDSTNPSTDRFQDTKDYPRWVGVGWVLRDYARGYHIYKDIWEAGTGEQLLCQRENSNCADQFAVEAVKKALSC